MTLTAMLDHLGLANRPVVVEHNEAAVFARDYPDVCLADGDRIEIVTLAAGG